MHRVISTVPRTPVELEQPLTRTRPAAVGSLEAVELRRGPHYDGRRGLAGQRYLNTEDGVIRQRLGRPTLYCGHHSVLCWKEGQRYIRVRKRAWLVPRIVHVAQHVMGLRTQWSEPCYGVVLHFPQPMLPQPTLYANLSNDETITVVIAGYLTVHHIYTATRIHGLRTTHTEKSYPTL